jgi:proline dehydrogenase
MRRFGMRLGAGRFVAGQTLEECVLHLRRLNEKSLYASATLLGEDISDAEQATRVARTYEAIMGRLAAERLRANVGLKLTNIGLAIDEGLAMENADRLAARAAENGMVLRVDMEESRTVDATLRTYRALRARGRENLEIALQAYLYRTEQDLRALLPLRPIVRLVKGAYLEPSDVAYPQKEQVDASYVRLLELALGDDAYVAAATHDERLIERTIRIAEERRVGTDRFEFQLLYGIREQLQIDLARRGYRVLVSVPYGPEWYPYLMRRLAERPANLLFFLANVFRR